MMRDAHPAIKILMAFITGAAVCGLVVWLFLLGAKYEAYLKWVVVGAIVIVVCTVVGAIVLHFIEEKLEARNARHDRW